MANPSSTPYLPTTGPVRALVADGCALHRWLAQQMLEVLGFDAIEAVDGRDLFWKIEALHRAQVPWIVLTDIGTPVYDGLDVLEAWRDDPLSPLVVMTAFPDDDVVARVRSLGGQLLSKPFTLEQLGSTLSLARAQADEPTRAPWL